MIRDRDVLHAHRFCAAHHRFERVNAVGISRVAMDYAFDVGFGDKVFRNLFRECGFDLALVFTQLRWNVSHAETFVELFFSTRETCETYLLSFRNAL